MRWTGQVGMWVTAALLAGCATVPEKYLPDTVGSLGDTASADAIEVEIEAQSNVVRLGQPVEFTITIRNVGEEPVRIPRNPCVIFTWTYPNGVRDNFLRDSEDDRYYAEHELVLLKPRNFIKKETKIDTYYFDKAGITEFRAIVQAARNTNPTLPACWSGRVTSNGYGVMVEGKKKGLLAARSDLAANM